MSATVTYEYPAVVAGTTVAPTTAQAAITTLITAEVQMGASDTVATLTHNWGLSTTQNSQLMPLVSFYPTNLDTAIPFITVSALGTNTITISKTNSAGTDGTWTFVLQKPHTINQ